MNYYNEHDPKAAAWLRELMTAGEIPPGDIDERSITSVQAQDLDGYTQHHFFAGIGGWSLALKLAGWNTDRTVWTGSCPCQPFSSAGKREGQNDERHLWPAFFRLIEEYRPDDIFGEQVASAIGHGWLDGIQADLEGAGYAVGHCVLGAHSAGAPHIRQRLYWVAYSNGNGCNQGRGGDPSSRRNGAIGDGCALWLGQPYGFGRGEGRGHHGKCQEARSRQPEPSEPGGAIWVVQSKQQGLEGHSGHEHDGNQPRWIVADSARSASEAGDVSAWSRCQLLKCTDAKTRRIEPESYPLADGIPGRVGLLRGYGNAIVPQTAAHFITAFQHAKEQLNHFGHAMDETNPGAVALTNSKRSPR